LFHKSQTGFTLIELMLAIAISGIITGGITATIFQVFNGSARTNNHMTAVRQVQNAGYWVSHDAQMAQDIVTGDDPDDTGFPLTLTWRYWDSSDVHTVVYSLTVDNKLQRDHYTNKATNPTPDATAIIAQFIQFIDPDLTKVEWAISSSFTLPDQGDAFTITGGAVASSGTITVTQGVVKATPSGGATVAGGTSEVTINTASTVPWTTPVGGGQIIVVANSNNGIIGIWTAPTGTATAAITADVGTNGDASITVGHVLTFTVTATVQEQSETRVYEVVPRPD
jgi:prepilin-type N-terminal cleavage/methylation domain-containing protein